MLLGTEGRRQEGRRTGREFSCVESLLVPSLLWDRPSWLWWKAQRLGDPALFPALIVADPQHTHFLLSPMLVVMLVFSWAQDGATLLSLCVCGDLFMPKEGVFTPPATVFFAQRWQ